MAITTTDLKEKMKSWLLENGMDENSADYLAELFVNSERGRNMVDGNPVPAGACNLSGFFPG